MTTPDPDMPDLDAPDPEMVMAASWPMTGPHTPQRVLAALDMAAKLIRYANHATAPGTGITLPAPDIDLLVATTKIMVDRLPQLVEQMASHLRRHADNPASLVDDRAGGTNAPVTARRAANELSAGDVGQAVRTLSRALDRTRHHTNHLRHP